VFIPIFFYSLQQQQQPNLLFPSKLGRLEKKRYKTRAKKKGKIKGDKKTKSKKRKDNKTLNQKSEKGVEKILDKRNRKSRFWHPLKIK
jgi:hypothetical protein